MLNDENDYGLIAIPPAIGRLSLSVLPIVIVAVLYQNLLDLFHDDSVASFLNLGDINLGYLDYIVVVVLVPASLKWREDSWSWLCRNCRVPDHQIRVVGLVIWS